MGDKHSKSRGSRESQSPKHSPKPGRSKLTSMSWEGTVLSKIPPELIPVLDSYGHPIKDRARIKPTYKFKFKIGAEGTNEGELNAPIGLTTDRNGSIFVADASNHRIQQFDRYGAFIKAIGDRSQFYYPTALICDPEDNLVIVDKGNSQIQILDPSGALKSKFGKKGKDDGFFNNPRDVTINHERNILICDRGNHRIQIFSPLGEFIRKFKSFSPVGVATDKEGKIYVCETQPQRIKVFDPLGVPISGFGSPSGGLSYPFPMGIAIDYNGHLILTDQRHNAVQIYSQAGDLVMKFGSEAKGRPTAVIIDRDGNILVSDTTTHRILVYG